MADMIAVSTGCQPLDETIDLVEKLLLKTGFSVCSTVNLVCAPDTPVRIYLRAQRVFRHSSRPSSRQQLDHFRTLAADAIHRQAPPEMPLTDQQNILAWMDALASGATSPAAPEVQTIA